MIPAHERRILEAHIRKVELKQLDFQDQPLNEYEQQELKTLIKLRMKGFPLQYLTGTQGFYGREFYVNTSVLVPRPETEGLVELALELLPPAEPTKRIRGLEFGAGSGCVSISIAIERPDVWMTASDCSSGALEVCRENANRHRVASVDFVEVTPDPHLSQYDGFGEHDFLISNPPYLMSDDEIADDVREHEPPEALYAHNEDPYFFYRFLAALLDTKVSPEGFGLFEIAHSRSKETEEIFKLHSWNTKLFQDLTGRDRYLWVKKNG